MKIAILTGYDYLDYAIRAIKIGVDDYAPEAAFEGRYTKAALRLAEKKRKPTASPLYGRRWII